MKGFKNAHIYVEGKGIIRTNLSFEHGVITAIGNISEKDLVSLPEDCVVVPGFIDEHIHGCHGHDAMSADAGALQAMANALLSEGVTFFCPTTMSMEVEDIKHALSTISDFMTHQTSGAKVLGIHVEGPFLSERFHGAQDTQYLMDCDANILEEFIQASHHQIKLFTFAPERKGETILPLLAENGITPSLGHSDATASEAKAAFDGGAHCLTHCFNAMRGFHHREVGLLGMGLLDDRVFCELIADLEHVSEDAIRLLFKTKGKQRIILVSDAMEAKYLPEGNYALGGQKVWVKNGTARLENGVLAGSVLRLDQALRNIHSVMPELSLTDLVDLVTKNPAKNLGLQDIGSIAVGKKACFTVLDSSLNVLQTILG